MSRLRRDLAVLTDRRRALGIVVLGMGGAAIAACEARAVSGATGACLVTPAETTGPFPADGSGRGAINVLDMQELVRRDIRAGFAGMPGEAEGAPLELELKLVGADAECAPLPGRAVYLWQNDAAGDYSLYNRTDTNYLRGLQAADGEGTVRFTAIVPGCYGGRYPHCHFEVFASVEAAQRGDAPLLVSQLAFPEGECRRIYAGDDRYGESLRNLDATPLARDFVFADADEAGRAWQGITLVGSPESGYRGMASIGLNAV